MSGLRKTTAKTITLDIDLIKKVEQLAVKENRSFSNMVETLLLSATKLNYKRKASYTDA